MCLDIARRLTVRNLPNDFALGQIDRGDPPVRWFDERKVTHGRHTRCGRNMVASSSSFRAID